MTKILAIDVGGTKTKSACIDTNGKDFVVSQIKDFANKDFKSFEDIAASLPNQSFDAVGIGIAGPVFEDGGRLTNLNWKVLKPNLRKIWGIERVHIVNDMTMQSYGVLTVQEHDRHCLQKGAPGSGNIAVIAAGTGLGEGFLARAKGSFFPFGCEGGHATFAPESSFDWRFAQFLRKKYQHVSWERIVSGRDGFRNIFEFLYEERMITPTGGLLTQASENQDIGATVIEYASKGEPASTKVLEVFCDYYGREAANLALKIFSTGGVYLAGGIAPRIIPFLEKNFVTAFRQKGRFSALLAEMPIYIVQDPLASLKGVALATLT